MLEASPHLWRRSNSLEEFEELMSGLLRPCAVIGQGRARYRTEVIHQKVAGLGLTVVQLGGVAKVKVQPDRSMSLLQIPVRDAFGARNSRGEIEAFSEGDHAQLIDARTPLELEFRAASRMLIVNLNAEQLSAIGATERLRNIHDPCRVSLATAAGRRLRRLSQFLIEEIQADQQGLVEMAALAGSLEQAMLAVLGETLAPPPKTGLPGRTDDLVIRAERFMRDHLDQALTPTEIAAAVGTSLRSLHRLFREQRNTTPLTQLKEIRLEHVHAQLQTGGLQANGLTDLAMRCGFNHMGLFAADYRQRFGCTPSETLRRHRQG